MGCWHGTCGISQLPIRGGDSVYGFIIGVSTENKGNYSGHCYAIDYAWPMSLPFRGEYNDYGGMENIVEGENTKLIFNKYNGDRAKCFEDFVNNIIERDAYPIQEESFCDGKWVMKYGLGLFMISESVYDSIYRSQWDYCDRSDEVTPEKFREDANRLFETFTVLPEEYNNESDSSKAMLARMIKRSAWETSHNRSAEERYLNHFSITYHGRGFVGSSRIDGMKFYRKAIENILETEGAYSNRLNDFIEMGHVLYQTSNMLSAMRKSWGPQSGKGSQSYSYDFYKNLALHTLELIKEYEEECIREEEESKVWMAKYEEEQKQKKKAKQKKNKEKSK